MDYKTISNVVLAVNEKNKRNRKGQWVTVHTSNKKRGVTKESVFQAQIGVTYDNMKSTREGRANGELPRENAGRNGMEWILFPWFMKGIKSGKICLNLCNVCKPLSTKYFWGDQQISAADGRLMRKDKPSRGRPTTISVGIENIVSISEAKKQG